MVCKIKKISAGVISFAISVSSILAEDIDIDNGQFNNPPIVIENNNTSINFKNGGFVNYANIGDEPSVVYIDGVKKDITNALTINVDSSSTINPFDQNQQFHVNASGNGKDVYAINLSNAKADFGINFNGEVFGAKSEVTNVGYNALNSVAVYLPAGGSNFNDDRDKSTIDFGNTRVRLESSIADISLGLPCSSVAVGYPILEANGANGIVLKKETTNDGSIFNSLASVEDENGEFDKVNSTVFGCGKISVSGLTEGKECSQLCNFDLSNFDLSKDEVTSISPRYASVIGAARVSANDGVNNVKINQFNNLHVKNTPKTVVSTAGVYSCDADSYAVVIGGGYVDANLTHGADNNGSCKISQFNDITIDSISGTLEAKAVGNNNKNSAAVIGCAKLSTIIGDTESEDEIENGHISQFNNISIGEISSPSSESIVLDSSSKYAIVIGSSYDKLEINGNATNSTIEQFNNLKVGEVKGISGKLTATGEHYATVLGLGYSSYELNGSDNNVRRFNDVTIGDIAEGANLGSQSSFNSAVIGSAYDELIVNENATNSTIEEFNNLKVGAEGMSGKLTATGMWSAAAIGLGYSDHTLNGSGNEIRRFNDVTIGDIAKEANLDSRSSFNSAVIGSASNLLIINSEKSTVEEFSNLKVAEKKGIFGKLNATSSMWSASVLGSGHSECTLNGSGSKVKRFNNVTIGDIAEGAKLSSTSDSSQTAVIGDAHRIFTINAMNSSIEEFNDLKVGEMGGISGELIAIGVTHVTVIGSGQSNYTLNGSGNEIRKFSDMTIGDIAEGAKLLSSSSSSNYCCAAVIGSAYDKLTINENAANSTLKEFSNLKVGNIAGTLKSEVIGNGNVYGSAIGCSCLDVNGVADIKNVKMFSDVSVQFQKGAIASSVGASSNGGTIYINTLGGQYNGYYGGEDNNVADGIRYYFNGVGKSSDNDIVIAALEHDNGESRTYSLTDECRSFAMGPNFQINVGRNRVIDSSTDRETKFSIENGGVRSKVPGILRILGNISKSQQNAGCENATMRIDGGWDAQCFGKVSDLQKIDIIEGSLNLMVSSDSTKAELNRAIGRIDDTGVIGDGFKGSLTLADGQMLRFGVSGNLDAKINEKFASKAFRSSDGRIQIRNDGQDDAGMLNLDGGKFSLNIKSRENIPSNSCFYVIRVDNPHDEDTNGSLINVDPARYEVSDENFNEGGYFGNVKMYKITDSDDKSIVSGKIGILSKNNVHAYKICDQSDQLLGIAIGPEEYGVNDLETITDSVSKSNSGVAVAQDAVASISSITSCVCSCIANGGTNASSQISDESSIAGIISGERQARYIGGGNYALSTQYKNRYSLNPKLFFSSFGEYGHQDKVSGLGYNYNLYGFTVGGSISRYLQSEARISVGIFGSFSDNTTKYCGEKSRLGMRNNQKMYFGGIFGSYEDYDISGLRTNLSVIVGGGRFKNKTWTRITDGGKVCAKFNSSDFHASADFVKNIINIGNSDFHCGPWMALSYNHIHENGHDVVCNGENIAAVSSTRFDFLDTTLGINFEKNISYSPEKNISGRIFAKAGWFCRPVRSHSSCTIRADGVDPVNSEFRFSDRNAAIVSGGFKFEFNKKWELSASITSRIAKHHWLINGNAVVGYSF